MHQALMGIAKIFFLKKTDILLNEEMRNIRMTIKFSTGLLENPLRQDHE